MSWHGLGPEHNSLRGEHRVNTCAAWPAYERRLNRKGIFYVDRVLNCEYREEEQTFFYWVKWKGYSMSENTWEPYCNVKNLIGIDAWTKYGDI